MGLAPSEDTPRALSEASSSSKATTGKPVESSLGPASRAGGSSRGSSSRRTRGTRARRAGQDRPLPQSSAAGCPQIRKQCLEQATGSSGEESICSVKLLNAKLQGQATSPWSRSPSQSSALSMKSAGAVHRAGLITQAQLPGAPGIPKTLLTRTRQQGPFAEANLGRLRSASWGQRGA